MVGAHRALASILRSESLAFAWNELFPAPWALQVLPIDVLIVLRLNASTAMRADGVGGCLNLLQIALRGIGLRRSFVLGNIFARIGQDLSVHVDETLGTTNKKSLGRCGTGPRGIRIHESRNRSKGQWPRVCRERPLHLPDCELQQLRNCPWINSAFSKTSHATTHACHPATGSWYGSRSNSSSRAAIWEYARITDLEP